MDIIIKKSHYDINQSESHQIMTSSNQRLIPHNDIIQSETNITHYVDKSSQHYQ